MQFSPASYYLTHFRSNIIISTLFSNSHSAEVSSSYRTEQCRCFPLFPRRMETRVTLRNGVLFRMPDVGHRPKTQEFRVLYAIVGTTESTWVTKFHMCGKLNYNFLGCLTLVIISYEVRYEIICALWSLVSLFRNRSSEIQVSYSSMRIFNRICDRVCGMHETNRSCH